MWTPPPPPLGMGPKISPLAFSALGLGFRLQYGRRKLERNALWECNLRLQNSLESNEQIAEISRDLIHRTGAMHQAIRGSKVNERSNDHAFSLANSNFIIYSPLQLLFHLCIIVSTKHHHPTPQGGGYPSHGGGGGGGGHPEPWIIYTYI